MVYWLNDEHSPHLWPKRLTWTEIVFPWPKQVNMRSLSYAFVPIVLFSNENGSSRLFKQKRERLGRWLLDLRPIDLRLYGVAVFTEYDPEEVQ